MKRILAAGTLAALTLTGAYAQTIQVNKDNKTIAITATDNATADPDIATVNIGFQIFAPDADTAYAQGSKISNAIFKKLTDAGVPDKAVQSNNQSLQRMDFNGDTKSTPEDRQQRQFTLSQSWTVKATAKEAASVLNIAVQAGANSSGQIDWDLADRNALEGKAAEKALLRARAIADQMAKGLNAKLAGLVYASNQLPDQRIIANSAMASVRVMSGADAVVPKVAPLAIRPQQVEESATVYAVFAIE